MLAGPAAVADASREYHAPGVDADDDSGAKPLRRWTPRQLAQFRQYVDEHPEPGYPWQAEGYRLTLSGLRRSEVLGLDWRNVDTKADCAQRLCPAEAKAGR